MNEKVIRELLASYKTPFYIFDDRGFKNNFKSLISAMRNYYPYYRAAYSYKTNYTPHICQLAKELGALAEVVSDMELSLARKIGYSDDEIIYNGPVKGSMLKEFLIHGGICNVDNITEAERIFKIASENKKILFKIGIRLNLDIGAGFVSRFGFDPEGDDMKSMLDRIRTIDNLKVVGLHIHISRARGLEAWSKRIEQMIQIADNLFIDGPEYLDLGSGMFADMEPFLKNQFAISVPTYEDYASVVASAVAEHYKHYDRKPILITEPGTTVVARYLSLITRVIGLKSIRGNHFAVVDGEFHHLGETGMMMKCPYSIIKENEVQTQLAPPLDVTGYTCLEQDVLFKNFPEKLGIGDVLEFRNIGGYSLVYKPPFIHPNCPVVAIDEQYNNKLIKRSETFEDIFNSYILK